LDSWESILRGKLRAYPTTPLSCLESLQADLSHRQSHPRRYRGSGPHWDCSRSDRFLHPQSIQSFSLDHILCRDAVSITFLLYNGSTTTNSSYRPFVHNHHASSPNVHCDSSTRASADSDLQLLLVLSIGRDSSRRYESSATQSKLAAFQAKTRRVLLRVENP